jgi:uncharacterized protein YigE (DUF2233 family)
MRLYCYTFCFIILLISCNNISSDIKKQIKETGREIAKQVKATAEHLDMVHDYIGFEAHPDSGQIHMYWKDDKGNILGSLGNVKKLAEQQGAIFYTPATVVCTCKTRRRWVITFSRAKHCKK